MPPEDKREEEEPEEEHRKVDKRASRDMDAEPAEDRAEPQEEGGEASEEPEPEEAEPEPSEPAATEEQAAPPEEAEEEEGAAPEISVYNLMRMSVGMYAQQAWIHMGVRMDPSTQKTEQNMPLAKVAVDTVAFLVDQLQPDLTPEEKRGLQSLVADLRINYVQRS